MKKGITLYLTFAVLCVIAVGMIFAGCNGEVTPSFNEGVSSVNISENPNAGLITSRFDNDDYDRTDVSNVVSNFGIEESTSSDNTSSSNTSSDTTSDVTSSDQGSSSESATSSGISYNSDNSGWTSRWN